MKFHFDFFNQEFECINTSGPLDLNGKLVVIDFWTYCCVNCMHIIPLLNRIEKDFENVS